MVNIFLYFLLAVLPGLIWLFYFLKKDHLPEPKMQILKIFSYGMIATIPAVVFELILIKDLEAVNLEPITYILIKYFFIIALVEESFKYLVVRFYVLKHSCFDEPIDVPLYMIISALGFATIENILVFSDPSLINNASGPFVLSLVRFIGPTFLHALCSALIGCFLAFSFYFLKFRWFVIFIGFTLSIIFHGIFDFYLELGIMNMASEGEQAYPLLSVFILGILVSFLLNRIKKIKSICKI
jgi:RsiW-degrading membrane proteinase PrsW (M82 family)